jgi:signal transduction histidine kinase/CheY-like chemotaxis protein
MHKSLNLARLLLLQAGLLLSHFAQAQSYSRVTALEERQAGIQLWTKGDGIPDWYLEGIFQDSRGILWIEWKGVFCRFDGHSIRPVAKEARGHYEFPMTYLGEDLQGNIWKLSPRKDTGQIKIFNPFTETFTTLETYLGKEADQLPAGADLGQWSLYSLHRVIYLYHRRNGQMWKYDGHLEQICVGTKEEIPDAEFIPAPRKGVWSLSGQDGVRLLDEEGRTVKHFPELQWLPLKPGLWWPIDKDPEIELLLTEDFRLQERLSEEEVRCLYSEQRLDKPRSVKTFFVPHQLQRHLSKRQSLPGELSGVQLDFNGINQLHLIKSESGDRVDLLPVINEALSELNLSVDESPDYVYRYNWPIVLMDGSILWMPQGRAAMVVLQVKPSYFRTEERDKRFYWMSAWGEKLYAMVQPGCEIYAYDFDNCGKELLIPYYFPINCLSTQADYLWYGYNGKIGKLSYTPPHTNQLIKVGKGEIEEGYEHMYDFLFLPDSLLWVATDQGAYELDLKSLERRPLIDGTAVNVFYRDRGGRVWAGTAEGVYSFSDRRYYLQGLPDAGDLDIVHFYEQSPDTYWLASRQGLVRWEPGSDRYKRFTTEDGLSDNIIHAVYPDKHGRLWLSTNYGISAFHPEHETVQSFFTKDGLSHNEQNFRAHAQDTAGRLYFGSLAGIHCFDPNEIPLPKDSISYDLFARYMTLYDSEGKVLKEEVIRLNQSEPYVLPRSCKQLSLKFSLPNYEIKKLGIEWRLANTREEWQQLSSNREFFMPSVPSGKLSLEFRVRNTETHNILGTYQLHFDVQKPLIYSLLFWLIVVVVISTIAALTWLWRLRSFRAMNQRLQKAIDEQTYSLQEKTKKLEKLDEAKSELFNNISHELRTPLTLIRLESELILEGKEPGKLERQAKTIQEQVEHMTSLLDDILQLNKAKMGLIRVDYSTVEWVQFLRYTFMMFNSLAEQKQIDYHLNIEPEGVQYLKLERDKLEHILQNLISNALKFTPEGGRILVRSRLKETEVEVVVSDTGPGIAYEDQSLIFERYYQARRGEDSTSLGYGIGLAMCREYTHLIDGKIWVESELGEGASFFLTFPKMVALEEAAEQKGLRRVADKAAAPRTFSRILTTDKEKPSILVVEDNPYLLGLLQKILSEYYQVEGASDGEEGFRLLEASPSKFKLVISDIMMPVVDGYALLNRTRSHPELGFIPFIFISALHTQEEQLKAYRLGVDGFISKPFESVELKTRVHNLIKNQELRQAFLDSRKRAKTGEPEHAGQEAEDAIGDESYDEAWLKSLEEVVQQHLCRDDLKVKDIAYKLHLSERTLRNYIKLYTGLTPSGYLQKARLDQAHLLLLKKKYKTIGEVAYAVGFKDARYFSSLYKKEFGKSPAEYL